MRLDIAKPTFFRRGLIAWLLAVAMLHAHAEAIVGRVVSVADGDTIVVLDSERVRHRIRLGAIDAPERGQPYGKLARQSLAELVAGKAVRVQLGAEDRYGRDVGVVWLGNLDVNQAQVERGMAWWYRNYADEQSAAMRARYERAEREAREQRRGLWARPHPVPPWEWRHRAG
jgi:endonuclease YncB( thermonuclease family)